MDWFKEGLINEDATKSLIDKIQKRVDKMKDAAEVLMRSPILTSIWELREDLDELEKVITKKEESK